MPHISTQDVQQWLESTKLSVSSVDVELEKTASSVVFSTLAETYDVTLWTDEAATPVLIQSIISMMVAAWVYNRQYSEDDPDGSGYAMWLLNYAKELLNGVKAGSLDLLEVPGVSASSGEPAFMPTDSTGSTQQYDARGAAIGGAYSEDIKFRMGDVW